MYPFERFTERAKKVLTMAQEEAERSHHSYIGTEHLLLGLLGVKEGVAARALDGLGVELPRVRSAVDAVLGRNERLIIQQIIPTSRVKRVIEMSFEEAHGLGSNHVGTDHLLLGLLLERESIAAHVLQDLGVTLDKARTAIAKVRSDGASEAAGDAPGEAESEGRHGPPAESAGQQGPPAESERRHGPPAESGGRHGRPAESEGHQSPQTETEWRHGPPAESEGEHGPPAESARRHGPPAESAGRHGRMAQSEWRHGPRAGAVDSIQREAERLAAEQHTSVGPEHLLLAALDKDPLVRRLLTLLGVDDAKIAELRRLATPPAPLVELRRARRARVAELSQRGHSVSVSEQDELIRLRDRLDEEEGRWRAGEEVQAEGGDS